MSQPTVDLYRKRPFAGLDGLTILLFMVVGALELIMIYSGSLIPVPEFTQQEIQQIFATRYKDMLKVEAPPVEAAAPATAVSAPEQSAEGAGEQVAEESPAEQAGRALERPVERQMGSAEAAAGRRSAAAERRASRRAAISQELVNSAGGISLVTGGRGGAASSKGLVDAAQVTGGGAISAQGLAGMVTGKAAENVRRLRTDGPKGGGTGGSGGVNLQGALTNVETSVGKGGTVGGVRLGQVQVYDRSGKFAGEQARSIPAITAAVDAYQPGLKDCFDRQLQRDATLKGSVLVKFTIKADGSVTNVEVAQPQWSDPDLGRRVESCIRQKISGWRFDPVDPKLGDFPTGRKLTFGS
jgi:hypothetical protein